MKANLSFYNYVFISQGKLLFFEKLKRGGVDV